MGVIFLLMLIGLVSLFSMSGIKPVHFFERQLLWVAVGLCLLVVSSLVDFRLFRTQSAAVLALYGVSIVLLLLVISSAFVIRGVRSWLTFGGFSVEPVELVKLALIILLAKFFSKRHVEIYRIRHLVVSGIYAAFPAVLVLIQPDLGSAIILMAIWIAVVVFSGMKLRHFVLLLCVFSIIAFIGWHNVLKPYQQSRIMTFLDPYKDPKGAGYQMLQSMIAVGSGRVWGKGLGYGSQTHLHFLPEPETDFIFAAFVEEWGFAGTVAILSLFFVLLWRIIRIGMRSSDNFSRVYCHGFAAYIFVQSFIHIGMNMGLMPITGITLPFVSYGGSSLVTLLIGVGIVQNIKINARRAVAGEM
ncbi:MAG: rod shape-determining protein RodA [Candidatus Sungbacteria bacterium]|nr:rod shape-determining protein RodA [Candidatus Sungbacteria bacterium]